MDVTNKSAQPSMEEILASIRKLLSEESEPRRQEIDFNARPIMLGGEDDDDGREFDLPAIFRSSSIAHQRMRSERSGTSLVRLTDAIRAVTVGMVAHDADAVAAEPAVEPAPGLAPAGAAEPLVPLAALEKDLKPASAAPGGQLEDVSFFEAGETPVSTPCVAEARPLALPVATEPREVQRVMASFMDTKFKSMGASPAQSEAEVPALSLLPETPTPAPQPPVLSERVPAPPSLAPRQEGKQGLSPSFPQAAIAHREEVLPPRGIEDAAADLLRPMLRSWLAEHMPKMVEKALVLEMRQHLGALRKSGGSDR